MLGIVARNLFQNDTPSLFFVQIVHGTIVALAQVRDICLGGRLGRDIYARNDIGCGGP